MNVVVNIVELASELAEQRMLESWMVAKDCYTVEELLESHYDEIYVREDDVITYTEDAQDDFNDYYCEIYNTIESCVIQNF